MKQPFGMQGDEEEGTIELEDLRADQSEAWTRAFASLWKTAWLAVRCRLPYDSPQQVEDLVAALIGREVVPQIVDLTSGAFLEASSFSDVLNITAKIVRNRAIDEIRRRTRLPSESSIDRVGEAEFSGGGEVQKREIADSLHSAIDLMDPRYGTLLHDHYFLGLTTAELAEKHERPRGSICSDLVRARELLRAKLDEIRAKLDEIRANPVG